MIFTIFIINHYLNNAYPKYNRLTVYTMDNTSETPASESSESSVSPNLLDEVAYPLYQASGGKRFANYLIDSLVFYLLWRFFVAMWFVQLLFALNFPIENRTLLYVVAYIGACFFLGLIIAGFEAATGGKTLGKYITGTRAVTDEGVPVGPGKALLRFLVRQIPFEAFSALGSPSYPWHDRWTKTLVIDEKLTTLPPQG
jgi:uncharacterized RDD family membrane protein YckC